MTKVTVFTTCNEKGAHIVRGYSIELTKEEQEAFAEILKNPPKPNEALIKLLKKLKGGE